MIAYGFDVSLHFMCLPGGYGTHGCLHDRILAKPYKFSHQSRHPSIGRCSVHIARQKDREVHLKRLNMTIQGGTEDAETAFPDNGILHISGSRPTGRVRGEGLCDYNRLDRYDTPCSPDITRRPSEGTGKSSGPEPLDVR